MIAVNIEVRIPTDRVTAKPLTGPVPIANRITAAISVVMLASRMVVNAREKPAWIADCGGRPFFSSYLMRSRITSYNVCYTKLLRMPML